MSAEWRKFNLGDLTDWSSGGTPSKKNTEFWIGTIPWISASSMRSTRYSESELKITPEGLKSGSRLAPMGSILLLVRGSILHQKIPVGITTRDVAFNQDVKAIQIKRHLVDSEVIDNWYLFYWFKANEKLLLSIVESTGIGAGKLDTKQLQGLEVDVPSWGEQQQIVACCKAIEEKEIINAQINQTLEQIAQAIFKSWFVDFEPVKTMRYSPPCKSFPAKTHNNSPNYKPIIPSTTQPCAPRLNCFQRECRRVSWGRYRRGGVLDHLKTFA